MSVSLAYYTTPKVDEQVKSAIKAEADRIEREWWSEGLYLTDDYLEKGDLGGHSKIFLISYTAGNGTFIEVEIDDEDFMAGRDAKFIVEQLCTWSKRFSLDWHVECGGTPVGQVSEGCCNPELVKFLRSFSEELNSSVSEAWIEQKANEISKKYSSRW